MLTLIAISSVVIALTMVIMTITVFRMAAGLNQAEKVLQDVSDDIRKTTRSFEEVAHRSRAVVHGLEASANLVGDAARRISELSSLVADEVEPPVKSTVALARGLRAGADVLLMRLRGRITGQAAGVDGNRFAGDRFELKRGR